MRLGSSRMVPPNLYFIAFSKAESEPETQWLVATLGVSETLC